MKYENYVFDLYGTLVDIRTDEGQKELWKKCVHRLEKKEVFIDPDAMRIQYHEIIEREKTARDDVRYPEVNVIRVFDEIFRGQLSERELNEFAWYFRRQSTLKLQLYDGVTELLEYIRNNGGRIILLSNAQACFTMPELKKLELLKYLDHVFISSDYGVCKPDEVFWKIMIDRTKIDPHKTVMIGNDYFSDISGAKAFGVKGIYIHQDISPQNEPEFTCEAKIMDGNVRKIAEYL